MNGLESGSCRCLLVHAHNTLVPINQVTLLVVLNHFHQNVNYEIVVFLFEAMKSHMESFSYPKWVNGSFRDYYNIISISKKPIWCWFLVFRHEFNSHTLCFMTYSTKTCLWAKHFKIWLVEIMEYLEWCLATSLNHDQGVLLPNKYIHG